MVAINPITAQRIKGCLEAFITTKVQDVKQQFPDNEELEEACINTKSSKGLSKPFHMTLIPKGITRIKALEQSLRNFSFR